MVIGFTIAVQCLVNEIPVETTLEDRILANQIPVIASGYRLSYPWYGCTRTG